MSSSVLTDQIQRSVKEFTRTHHHPPRIMLLSEANGTLGHARLMSILAKHIREMGGEVIVASGDIDDETFDFGDALRKLPIVTHNLEGDFTADGKPYLEDAECQQKRKETLLDIANDFKPDVVAFELFPLSYHNFREPDMMAMQEYKEKTGKELPFIAIARDNTVGLTGEKPKNALESFDSVLVRGWEEIKWDTPEWGEFDIPIDTKYLGHILAEQPANDNAIPDEQKPVMVFSSGGYLPEDQLFFEQAIKASKSTFAKQPWKLVISNQCPEDVFQVLKEKAGIEGNGKITVTRPYDNKIYAQDIANCKSAIVRGSYSTTLELASKHKPFVVVPRSKKGFAHEHVTRAEFLARNNIACMVTEAEIAEEKGVKKLADALLRAQKIKPEKEFEYGNGSQFAAHLLKIAMQKQVKKQSDSFAAKGPGNTVNVRAR